MPPRQQRSRPGRRTASLGHGPARGSPEASCRRCAAGCRAARGAGRSGPWPASGRVPSRGAGARRRGGWRPTTIPQSRRGARRTTTRAAGPRGEPRVRGRGRIQPHAAVRRRWASPSNWLPSVPPIPVRTSSALDIPSYRPTEHLFEQYHVAATSGPPARRGVDAARKRPPAVVVDHRGADPTDR